MSRPAPVKIERSYHGQRCEAGCGREPTQRAIWFGPPTDKQTTGVKIERFLCNRCVDTASENRPRKVEPLPGYSKYVDAEARREAAEAKKAYEAAQLRLGEDWGLGEKPAS